MVEIESFLSDNVRYLLVDMRKNVQIRHDCLRGLFFDWEKINSVLKILDVDSVLNMPNDWFIEKIEVLWGIMESAGESLFSSKCEKREELWHYMTWIGDHEWIPTAYQELIKCNSTVPIEITLKLTSYLERALGNVYLLKGKQVPFLLRDLLNTSELAEILGKIPVVFMQLLFGCVSGLNIRNISWHGFLAPNELHPNLVGSLLILTSTIGKSLSDMVIQPRPLVLENSILGHSNMLTTLPEYVSHYFEHYEHAINKCPYIASIHRIFWFRAYHLHAQQRYGDSLILILPQLENMLRSIYCSANNCHQRILTAESTSFYTTLDDILAPSTELSGNKVGETIGENILEILMDTFSYQDGPRLRDRLSHGEMLVKKINAKITNHIFFLALCIIYKVSYEKSSNEKVWKCDVCRISDADCIFSIVTKLRTEYEPLFHPIALLKQSMLKVLDVLFQWNIFPKPQEFFFTPVISFCDFITSNESFDSKEAFNFIQRRIISLRLPTLNRPRRELELVSLMSHIMQNVKNIHEMVTYNATTRYVLWQEKKLRTRGRVNYAKMWKYLPSLQNSLLNILVLTCDQLSNIANINEENFKLNHRYLKMCLQHVENILTFTSLEKNKWDEINILISEMEIARRKFLQQKY